MRLVLAPMEGLTDPLMRRILTDIGGYDWCVSEFIRVTDKLLPQHVIHRFCPELENDWCTASGTPLHVQFLGSDPVCLAENAAQAAEMGAPAIDLNFGCPAKTVNKHRGGAVLLDEPELMYNIIHAVRQAVPDETPVSAKIRLGYEDNSRTLDIGHAVEQANASWLTIHARTKTQGYKPPAYWSSIKPLSDALNLPIFANGEIWTVEQAKQCQQESGCTDLMLGRGAVTRPDLARRLRNMQGNGQTDADQMLWAELVVYLQQFLNGEAKNETVLLGRFKQWFGMLTKGYVEAEGLWRDVRKEQRLSHVCQLVL